MRLLVFGSLNIDHTYHLPHFVRAGETLASSGYQRSEGGKGFNQAVALAKAGQEVCFAGAIGRDGIFLKEYLQKLQVNTDHLRVLDAPTGHAIIQVDENGQNSILLFGGLWGLVGMIIAVPLFAVLYDLAKRLIRRGLFKNDCAALLKEYEENCKKEQ